MKNSVEWANENAQRWAFTLSNAGSSYFEDRSDLAQLHEINWDAVRATKWSGDDVSPTVKEGKQAEFLVEQSFPWTLISRIGVRSQGVYEQVGEALKRNAHKPHVEIKPDWYY